MRDETAGLAVPIDHLYSWTLRLGQWAERPHWLVFSLLVLTLGGLRFGLKPVGPPFVASFVEAAQAFPAAVNQNSTSLGIVLLMRGLGISGLVEWWFVAGLGCLASLLALALALRRMQSWWRVTLVVVVLSPAFGVLVGLVGHYDLFTVAGSVVVVTARRHAVAAVGGVIACLGNPEQMAIAALALAIVSVALSGLRLRAGLLAGVVLLWTLGLRLLHGADSARLDLLVDRGMMLTSLRRWLADWPLATWAFLGPLWILLALCLTQRPWRARIAILAGCVVIPAVASILTLDGTRVFVATGIAALVGVVHLTWRERWSTHLADPSVLGVAMLGLLFLPALVMLPSGAGLLHQPYDSLLNVLGWLFGPEKMSTNR